MSISRCMELIVLVRFVYVGACVCMSAFTRCLCVCACANVCTRACLSRCT
jgi:hypothetical protein